MIRRGGLTRYRQLRLVRWCLKKGQQRVIGRTAALGFFPPNGARQEVRTADTMTEWMLKAVAAAKQTKLLQDVSYRRRKTGRFQEEIMGSHLIANDPSRMRWLQSIAAPSGGRSGNHSAYPTDAAGAHRTDGQQSVAVGIKKGSLGGAVDVRANGVIIQDVGIMIGHPV
jgi:hypothetical protein